MYIRPLFSIPEIDALQQVMRDYPLATLIADSAGEMEVNLLPLLWVESGSFGRLFIRLG
ncbi:FMN-binding negative transcriptional regulator [Comamonas guangdongensis]|uniref:FMN-binding negative transcriptional regulator n=1 Tax=Comamonas guangdongensis TaxID=510515 RepID=A0ABV3ZZM4_9BURK